MKLIRILHISDLHFDKTPPSNKADEMGQIKDNAISHQLGSQLVTDCRERFIIDIKRLFPEQFDVIACTGDIANASKNLKTFKKNINDGAEYISRLASNLSVTPNNVIIAPGNHDIVRKRKLGGELNEFSATCEKFGFSYVGYTTNSNGTKSVIPTEILYANIPLIAMNSCLGGTEHAHHDIPLDIWQKELKKLGTPDEVCKKLTKVPNETKYQLVAMDIPALGRNQIDKLSEQLHGANSDCVIILMHHNPLPTNNIEVRPYANLIDSGIMLKHIFQSKKKTIILHGHTHCNSDLSVFKHNNNEEEKPLVVALGNKGLSSRETSMATVVELAITNDSDFIKADIHEVERNSTMYEIVRTFYIKDFDVIIDSDFLSKVPKNQKILFESFATRVGEPPDEILAGKILKYEPYLKIINRDKNFNDWKIIRLI